MTKIERLFPIFGIAFALIYMPSMNLNWAFATYHPKQGIWQWGVAPPIPGEGGPAMYWYGFVMTSFVGALAVTVAAALVPEKITARLPWPTLTWLLPLCAMFYFGWVLLPYFTK
jgi:hypothetical protein